MNLRRASLLAVPLAALAIAGCGGGDDKTESTATTTETTAALSKADFVTQGDAICAEVNSAVGAVGASGAEVPSQIIQVSDLYIGMVDSLKRLGMPEDASGYSEFMEAAEQLAKVEGEVKLASEREDTAAIGEAATKAAPALEEFQARADAYGFEECSQGPSAPRPTPGGAEAGSEEEVAPEGSPEAVEEEIVPEAEEAAPEEAAPEEVAPEAGGTGPATGGGETGGSSGGIGPG